MLTLLETITAINTLDTPKDVIAGACTKVLGLTPVTPETMPNEGAVKKHILTVFEELDPATLGIACLELGAFMLGSLTKPGHETASASKMRDIATRQFARGLHMAFEELLREDPLAAFDMLHGFMQQAKANKGAGEAEGKKE